MFCKKFNFIFAKCFFHTVLRFIGFNEMYPLFFGGYIFFCKFVVPYKLLIIILTLVVAGKRASYFFISFINLKNYEN